MRKGTGAGEMTEDTKKTEQSGETFEKISEIETTAEKSFAWHERPGALMRLTPPWQKMEVETSGHGIAVGTRVKMRNRFFGFSVTLEAEHIDYQKGRLFQDTLIKSPFSSWVHTHLFSETDGDRSVLTDRIRFRLPWYFPWFVKKMIFKELKRIFRHRHDIFMADIRRHNQAEKPLTILISGASGLLGSALIPFFTTGGHRVFPLVRREPDYEKNERYWNPETGEIDLSGIGPIDVVINLNGAPIAEKRWTVERRKVILESRIRTTAFLAETIAALPEKPELFISASAIGYYGDCGQREINESEGPGDLFIADVCRRWEEAAQKASAVGIRTVLGRIGVVLTADGGALEQMLPAFSKGVGARLGNGRQMMSWVSLEDTIGAIWHIIMNRSVTGPVNIVSPEPVSNKVFTKILGKVLKRPSFFVLPAFMVRMLWGEMGEEVLLSSANVDPGKLRRSGYEFCHTDLETALRAEMGLFKDDENRTTNGHE